ncbi:MAG: hypothetical protein LBB81_11900, partial [Treponema sp.]|nr:hypothetical protein [Treponema sp.]
MKKLFALVAIFAFIFAACGEEEDMPDSGTLKTTLTVSNLSDYGLLRVEYSSVDFGDINSGKENTKEVSAGTKYVFFFLQTTNGKIRCKTEALTCNEGVKNEITITNNSAITTAVTERRDTLKNLLYTLNNEPANPKIKILYDNYPVSSDGIIPLYDVATGSNKYIVLKIVNEGEHDLVITGTKPQISGTNAAQVVTENYPSVRLAYNEFINLSMQFTPTITGNNSFTITIINNDQINGTYTVQVTAKVINTWQKLHGASGRRYGIYRAVSNGEGGMYAGGYTSNNTGALFNIDQNGEVKTISSYPSYDGTIGPEGIGMGIARDDYFSVYKAFYNDKEYYITKST